MDVCYVSVSPSRANNWPRCCCCCSFTFRVFLAFGISQSATMISKSRRSTRDVDCVDDDGGVKLEKKPELGGTLFRFFHVFLFFFFVVVVVVFFWLVLFVGVVERPKLIQNTNQGRNYTNRNECVFSWLSIQTIVVVLKTR